MASHNEQQAGSHGISRPTSNDGRMDSGSPENIRLLSELSSDAAAQSFPMAEVDSLPAPPNWSLLERTGLVDSGAISFFTQLQAASATQRIANIRAQMSVYFTVLNQALVARPPSQPAADYLIWVIYECVRDDAILLDDILETVDTTELFHTFLTYLSEPQAGDRFGTIKDKAGCLLSSLIARALKSAFSLTQVQCLVDVILKNELPGLSLHGRMEFIKNLLKQDRFRGLIWDAESARDLILGALERRQQEIPILYLSLFCLWLLSFNGKLVSSLHKAGVVPCLCGILRESKTDKVVRLAIRTIINLLGNDDCVEQLIVENAVHTLTLLEYEKWRDEELFEEIHGGLAAMQNRIKLISNFERYCRELNGGKLSWSYLHSEKFWKENVMNFEDNKFAAVGKLADLLCSSDPTTVAVACHDLGEFARFHPTGKHVIRRLKIKDVVMTLMAHRDRDVLREALLSVQKMMLAHWQNVAEGSSSTVAASTALGGPSSSSTRSFRAP